MEDYTNVKEIFGCDVFNDSVMQDRLPKKVYRELKKTIEDGKELSMEIADVVAHEMKEWAIEKGACTEYLQYLLWTYWMGRRRTGEGRDLLYPGWSNCHDPESSHKK